MKVENEYLIENTSVIEYPPENACMTSAKHDEMSQIFFDSEQSSTSQQCKKRKKKSVDPAQPMYEMVTIMLESLKEKSNSKKKQQIDHFALFVSKEMERIDQKYYLECKHEIINCIMKYQLLSKSLDE